MGLTRQSAHVVRRTHTRAWRQTSAGHALTESFVCSPMRVCRGQATKALASPITRAPGRGAGARAREVIFDIEHAHFNHQARARRYRRDDEDDDGELIAAGRCVAKGDVW